MDRLTLIIPAKKEKLALPKVLDELTIYNYNSIVVLSPSDVDTIDAIKNYKNCKIIYQENEGYGDALIKGISSVETELFAIFNADGSFNPSEIKNMINKIDDKNLDILFASRYEKNSGSDDDTIITFIGNKIFSFLGKFLFNLPITDILYTFVIGKVKKVKNLNLISNDFAFCVELPIKAFKNGLKISSISSGRASSKAIFSDPIYEIKFHPACKENTCSEEVWYVAKS